MFFIKNIFIELTLKLFKFSIDKSDWFVMIPSTIICFVKVERVEKNIINLEIKSFLVNC